MVNTVRLREQGQNSYDKARDKENNQSPICKCGPGPPFAVWKVREKWNGRRPVILPSASPLRRVVCHECTINRLC